MTVGCILNYLDQNTFILTVKGAYPFLVIEKGGVYILMNGHPKLSSISNSTF